jgi:hypothetical protein
MSGGLAHWAKLPSSLPTAASCAPPDDRQVGYGRAQCTASAGPDARQPPQNSLACSGIAWFAAGGWLTTAAVCCIAVAA